MIEEKLILKGNISAEVLKEKRYVYVPFEVPRNTRTIEIEYSYSPSDDCKIDIGLFQPGTLELIKGMKNFRGWSGTAKKKFFISETRATPGYIPGKIEFGIWHIILGLYEVPSEGCRYRILIRFVTTSKPNALRNFSKDKRVTMKKGWIRGDFHLHSVHSDGDASIDDIAKRALERKLDFVALSDHNTFSHVIEAKQRGFWIKGVLFVPSVEVTTYYGHMNVFGIKEPIEFRITSEKDLLRIVDYIKSKGYVSSVSHPKPLGPDWEWGRIEYIGTVEVWHTLWEFNNYISLSKLDKLLSKGYRLSIIGGSDAHMIKEEISGNFLTLGYPTTWLYVSSMSVQGILDAVRRRHVFISESPTGPRISIYARTKYGSYTMGDIFKGEKAKVDIIIQGAKGHLFRAVSIRGVEFYETIDKDVYKKTLTVPRDVCFLRFETLSEAPNPSEPYAEENVLSSMSSPVFFE